MDQALVRFRKTAAHENRGRRGVHDSTPRSGLAHLDILGGVAVVSTHLECLLNDATIASSCFRARWIC
jgi:hypothetical protein